jgi:hypothetical protein
VDKTPTGDTDGFIQLIFSSRKKVLKEICELSEKSENAIIFVCFRNTDELVSHLYLIEKYKYILSKVLLDKSDKVAINEINNLMEYEKVVLNKSISNSLFAYNGEVTWIFKGEEREVCSLRDFNQLLSVVCDEIYSQTPVMNNELFNKHKLVEINGNTLRVTPEGMLIVRNVAVAFDPGFVPVTNKYSTTI